MWLPSRPLGVVRIRWGFCRRGWRRCDGDGCRGLRSMHDPGVDLVGDSEGMPLVVLGFEGDPRGFSHDVVPAHSGPPHPHDSLDGAHVGGQLLGGELCSPFSAQHDPCEGVPRVVAAITNGGDNQVDACYLPIAWPMTLREYRPRLVGRRCVFRPARPWRRIDAATARTPTSTPARIRA